jgi:hypothetical protein
LIFLSAVERVFSVLSWLTQKRRNRIRVGEESNVRDFYAYSGILRYRSKFFNEVLSEDVKKEDGKYIIEKPNIASQALDVILK